ncbi:transcriptional regulator [Mycobacteroides abscessus]|nr:transcriptional regulator [Mycobacteroides abscessus]
MSAALVVHHFGSKDGLRRACDAYVFDAVRAAKTDAISPQDPAAGPMALFTQLAGIEDYAPVFEYTLRSLQAGGDLARSFVEHLTQVTLEYMEDGVAAGVIRPSRDEPARARYLVSLSLGSLLVDGALRERTEPRDPETDLREYVERVMLPALEVFTEGLFVEPTLLDAYVRHTAHQEETR